MGNKWGTVRKRLDEEKQLITEAYLAGESTCSLGRRYGCSNASIFLALRDWGVPIRQTKMVAPNYDRILELHKQGLSAYRIDRELGLPKSTSEKALRKAGIDISYRQWKREDPLYNHTEEIVGRYQAGEGVSVIAKDYGCQDSSMIMFLRRQGIKLRSLRHYSYPVNEGYFDIVDTEEKAYILGLFMADGCNQQQVPVVALAMCDEELVKAVAKELQFEGLVKFLLPKGKRKQTIFSIHIGSRRMSDSLGRLGCVSRKSWIATFPNEDIVPLHLQRHLVRGWLDGDGTITCHYEKGRWYSRIVGTEAVCKGLSEVVNKHLGFPASAYPVHKGPKHTTWGFTIGGRDQLYSYLSWLYLDSSLHLRRKFDKYLEFCRQHNLSPVATKSPGV